MENENQNQFPFRIRLNPLLATFFVIQIIFIVLLILSISRFSQTNNFSNSPNQGPTAKIENVSAVIPEDHAEWANLVEWALFNDALKNNTDQNISKTSTVAYIREGSVNTQYFESQGINYVNAIVDIPELAQSYEIFLEYPNSKNAIDAVEYSSADVMRPYSILCLNEASEIIYADFDCQEPPVYASRQRIVSNVLGYFEFEHFSPSYSFEQGSNKIDIYPYSFDIDDDTRASYVQQTKDAIASLGISPDLFTYYVIKPEDISYRYPPE